MPRQSQSVFHLSEGALTRLERSLSLERLTVYSHLANGNRRLALALYEWNTALSESLHGPLQALEVTLRNAIDSQLQPALARADWYECFVMRESETEALNEGKERIQSEGKHLTPGRIVAALHLGFWVALIGSFYAQALWDQHLHKCFSPPVKRSKLYSDLNSIRSLRNRIAHYEPILTRNLPKDFQKITNAIRLICPTTETWVRKNTEFLEHLANRPVPPEPQP